MAHERGESGNQGRRERRIARRRGRIMAAAAQVFAGKGYASATIKEIAEAADIAEGTLYNYFDSKREILLAIADETETPMIAALRDADRVLDRDEMVALFARALDISQAQLPFTQAVLSESWVDDALLEEHVVGRIEQIHQVLTGFMTRQVDGGMFRSLDPSLGAYLVMAMFGGLIVPALRGVAPLPSPAERKKLSRAVVDLLLDGALAREQSG